VLPCAAIITTEGITSSATLVTEHALTALDAAAEPEDVAVPVQPPTAPPMASAAPAAAHWIRRRFLKLLAAPCSWIDMAHMVTRPG
jgi:hypothetical protein